MTFPWPFLWRLQENLTNLFLGSKIPDILTSSFILIKNVERAWFDEELTAICCYVCFHSCLHRDAYIQRTTATCPIVSVSNLHHAVLASQAVYYLCLRQTPNMRKPDSRGENLDHRVSFCDGNATRDKYPAFLFWWWTTGLVSSLNYAMTTNSKTAKNKWSTGKIKHDSTSCYFSETTEKLP